MQGVITPTRIRTVTITKAHADLQTDASGNTIQQNTANVDSDLIELKAPNQVGYQIDSGHVLQLELKKSDGTHIDPSSQLFFFKKVPGIDQPQFVEKMLYETWRYLTAEDQNKAENADQIRVHFPGIDAIQLRPGESYLIRINSPDVVAHAQSRFAFKALTFPVFA